MSGAGPDKIRSLSKDSHGLEGPAETSLLQERDRTGGIVSVFSVARFRTVGGTARTGGGGVATTVVIGPGWAGADLSPSRSRPA
jgi:hypothetical protein